MRNTQELRVVWAPACRPQLKRFILHSGAPVSIDYRTEESFKALDSIMRLYNYIPRAGETWGYNCRKITGGSGYSLHAYGITIDYNSLANPYGKRLVTDMPRSMVEAILAIRTNKGDLVFGWGGNYRNNKDAMHYEIVASPVELAAGINWNTVKTSPKEVNELFEVSGFVPVEPLIRDPFGRYAFWAWRADFVGAFNGAPGPIPNAEAQVEIKRQGGIRSMHSTQDGGYFLIIGEPGEASGWTTWYSKDLS